MCHRGSLNQNKNKKTKFDDVMKQRGIMGVVVIPTISGENLPDESQAQIK